MITRWWLSSEDVYLNKFPFFQKLAACIPIFSIWWNQTGNADYPCINKKLGDFPCRMKIGTCQMQMNHYGIIWENTQYTWWHIHKERGERTLSYQHVECFQCDPLLKNSNYYWVHAVNYHHPTHSSVSLYSKEHGPMHMPMYSSLRKNCPSYVLGNYTHLLELNIMTIYATAPRLSTTLVHHCESSNNLMSFLT